MASTEQEQIRVIVKIGSVSVDGREAKPTDLINAVKKRDLDRVKHLVEEDKVDVNEIDAFGMSALHHAAKIGNQKVVQEIVKYLLQHDAKINLKDKWKRTPLYYAAYPFELGHEVAYILIDNKADINSRDEGDFTPLHQAASRDNIVVARRLLKEGADKNPQTIHGQTPYHCAAIGGSPNVLKVLSESGADHTLADKEGRTPAQVAIIGMIPYFEALETSLNKSRSDIASEQLVLVAAPRATGQQDTHAPIGNQASRSSGPRPSK